MEDDQFTQYPSEQPLANFCLAPCKMRKNRPSQSLRRWSCKLPGWRNGGKMSQLWRKFHNMLICMESVSQFKISNSSQWEAYGIPTQALLPPPKAIKLLSSFLYWTGSNHLVGSNFIGSRNISGLRCIIQELILTTVYFILLVSTLKYIKDGWYLLLLVHDSHWMFLLLLEQLVVNDLELQSLSCDWVVKQ